MESVSFKYGNTPIFDDINMELPFQGMVLIKGKNGSGKSSLLKLIKGDLKPQKGHISIDGNESSLDVSYYYISQVKQSDIILNDTIENNIIFYDEKETYNIEDLVSNIVSSEIKYNQYVQADSLSGGEKRSLLFARGLYHRKQIILLDEVDTGMDSKRWINLVQILHKISGSTLVIAITHRELSDSDLLKWDYVFTIENCKIKVESQIKNIIKP
jgi:ATP-binding cassette subfamily B protein AbcA/BmrA